jgi:hypothetical protein
MYEAVLLVVGLIFLFWWIMTTVKPFVSISGSVGCSGDACAILPRAQARPHVYNSAPSWYVYGPMDPPFVSYLRAQKALANRDAGRDWSASFGGLDTPGWSAPLIDPTPWFLEENFVGAS